MNISTAKEPELQHLLFPELGYESRVCTIAACRNYMGDLFEELTVDLVGGKRLKTDSTKDVCPDIQIEDNLFAESKSIGCSGAIIVYQCRLEKDLEFLAETGAQMHYVLWHHSCRITEGAPLGDLRTLALTKVRSVTVIPLPALAEILKQSPLITLNKKCRNRGYGAYGYTDGYRIPYAKVRDALPSQPEAVTATAYGRTTNPFTVYGDAGRIIRG